MFVLVCRLQGEAAVGGYVLYGFEAGSIPAVKAYLFNVTEQF
jgi:hypothetical protein